MINSLLYSTYSTHSPIDIVIESVIDAYIIYWQVDFDSASLNQTHFILLRATYVWDPARDLIIYIFWLRSKRGFRYSFSYS